MVVDDGPALGGAVSRPERVSDPAPVLDQGLCTRREQSSASRTASPFQGEKLQVESAARSESNFALELRVSLALPCSIGQAARRDTPDSSLPACFWHPCEPRLHAPIEPLTPPHLGSVTLARTTATMPHPGQAQTGQPQSRIPRPRTTSSNVHAARSPNRSRLPSSPQQPDQHAQEPTVTRRQSVPIHGRTRQPPLIERRLSDASSFGSSNPNADANANANTNANKRRALSLSISIPPSPAPSNRPPAPVPVDVASSTRPAAAAAAATRCGHSRTASRESAASSSFASTPRDPTAARSPQRVRQPPRTGLDSAIGRRCSCPVPVSVGGLASASSPASASPSPFNRPPRTPYPFPRTRLPALERTLSDSTMATYTSFDLQHPKTPDEERGEAAVREERRWWDLRRWWSSGARSSSYLEHDRDDERTALLAAQSLSSSRRPPQEADLENQVAPLLGRQTRIQYVWGEVKCYARVSRALGRTL